MGTFTQAWNNLLHLYVLPVVSNSFKYVCRLCLRIESYMNIFFLLKRRTISICNLPRLRTTKVSRSNKRSWLRSKKKQQKMHTVRRCRGSAKQTIPLFWRETRQRVLDPRSRRDWSGTGTRVREWDKGTDKWGVGERRRTGAVDTGHRSGETSQHEIGSSDSEEDRSG